MSVKLPLSKVLAALIDDEDYERASKYRWKLRGGYAESSQACPAHWKSLEHFVLRAGPDDLIDHRDGNPLNNQKSNLRVCTPAENARNAIVSDAAWKTSRFKGVSRFGRRWLAQITCDAVVHRLGTFVDELEAARAYDAAAIRLFREFAKTNEMMGLFEGRSPHEARKLVRATQHKRTKKEWTAQQKVSKWERVPHKDRRTAAGIQQAYLIKGGHIIHFPPGMSPST